MYPERCLHVCLIGDGGIGISSFLRTYRNSDGSSQQANAMIESLVVRVELDGEPYSVRFTDNAGSPYFDSVRATALSTAHVVLFCFSKDSPQSLANVRDRWLLDFWATGSEAPTFALMMRSDLGGQPGDDSIEQPEAVDFALRQGMLALLECSTLFPNTVRWVVDEALSAAKEFYHLQWQLHPEAEAPEPEAWRHPVAEAREEAEGAPWVTHERLNVIDDPRCLDEETASKGLSFVGVTPTRQHAFLRLDIPDLSLTSVDVISRYKHLQFVNVSNNQLRTLEPLGALRCLLHLNVSYNLLIRTQSFTAPDGLETIDMSYNMIGGLGHWGVHKYLRELNLRGNFISKIGPGLRRNAELRMLDLSENHIPRIENLDGLGLRTLFLAQNRLTSLEGIGSLSKLQVLNVRHNNIVSVAALRSEDIPRLRKLFVSENRISRIKEIEGLHSFQFLCDLVLVPNPVAQLPYYRAQVAHRLPRLRSLDAEPVPAEEKEKADIIYGSDVETRQKIFKELLPEEPFVDRRLVTEEGIEQLELKEFGQPGDAGPYGNLPPQKSRTRLQEAKFQQRLQQARRGAAADLAEFAAPFVSVSVRDEDVRGVLEAVAEGRLQRLSLGACPQLTAAGVRELLAYLRFSPELRHVDLSGCTALTALGPDLLASFPFVRGCSFEAADSGLPERSVERLRNQTSEADEALQRMAQDRERTEELLELYVSRQDALEDLAEEQCSREAPPPPPLLLCHPAQWRDSVDGAARASFRTFRVRNPSVAVQGDGSLSIACRDGSSRVCSHDEVQALVRQRDAMLQEWELADQPLPQSFESAFHMKKSSGDMLLGFMLWEGAEPQGQALRWKQQEWEVHWRQLQERFAALSNEAGPNAQLLAHFSWLAGKDKVQPPAHFGLKRSAPMGSDLHSALSSGKVVLVSAMGRGFWLRLKLASQIARPVDVVVRRGTVFQQESWTHRQDLVTAVEYVVTVPPNREVVRHLSVYCMNLGCAGAEGNAMGLTEFCCEDPAVLESQGRVWDHFESCFAR